MPRLEMLSTNPTCPAVTVRLSADEAERLGGPRHETDLVVTLDLDWATIWPLYRKAVTSKRGKVRVGNGTLRVSRQR